MPTSCNLRDAIIRMPCISAGQLEQLSGTATTHEVLNTIRLRLKGTVTWAVLSSLPSEHESIRPPSSVGSDRAIGYKQCFTRCYKFYASEFPSAATLYTGMLQATLLKTLEWDRRVTSASHKTFIPKTFGPLHKPHQVGECNHIESLKPYTSASASASDSASDSASAPLPFSSQGHITSPTSNEVRSLNLDRNTLAAKCPRPLKNQRCARTQWLPCFARVSPSDGSGRLNNLRGSAVINSDVASGSVRTLLSLRRKLKPFKKRYSNASHVQHRVRPRTKAHSIRPCGRMLPGRICSQHWDLMMRSNSVSSSRLPSVTQCILSSGTINTPVATQVSCRPRANGMRTIRSLPLRKSTLRPQMQLLSL